MELTQLRRMLAAARRLRGGAVDLADVDAASLVTLGNNLAGVCRTIALWADMSVADRRAADAFVRFYGLGQMPERRVRIAATLRTRDGNRGLSVDTLDELIDGAEQQLAAEIDHLVFPQRWGEPTPDRWCDPFPVGLGSDRRRLQSAVLLAWADVPAAKAAAHQAARALLLYEHEHGMREPVVTMAHRQERARLRRLAWSMVWTARQRLVAREPGDVVIDRLLGPRHLATVDRLPDGVAELLVGVPSLSDRDAVELVDHAMGVARDAVRSGAPTAAELVGLLRDALARLPVFRQHRHDRRRARAAHDHRPRGRAHRRPSVRQRRRQHWARSDQPPARPSPIAHLRRLDERVTCDHVRAPGGAGARRTGRRARHAGRRETGAPSDASTDRLQGGAGPSRVAQQYYQTAASVLRHTALASLRPSRWLDAAERAAEMSWRLAVETDLPPGTVVAAANQRTAVALARLRLLVSPGSRENHRRLLAARRRVDEAIALAEHIDSDDRPHRSALVGAYRRRWELAQLSGEHDEVIDARQATLAHVGDWTPATQLVKLDRLARTTPDSGA